MPYELAYCELFNPNFHGWDNEIKPIYRTRRKTYTYIIFILLRGRK